MKQIIKIFILLVAFLVLGNSATINQLIGESSSLSDVIPVESTPYISTSSTEGCDCSDSISDTLSNLKDDVKDYTDANIKAFKELREQIVENKYELANRTNNIVDDKYYDMLNKGSSYIKSNSSSGDIAKYKLLGYENVLHLSANGLVSKNKQIESIYSNINELNNLEASIKINSKKK